jgi:hypothetical protein
MILLAYIPLATVLVGMISITYVRCHDFDCTDVMQDVLACDVCRCYEDGGFGCLCCTCTVCENSEQSEQLYDDSSDAFRSYYYSKKS